MTLRSLPERAARWSARHRRRAIVGWLAFTILAAGLGGAIGTDTLKQYEKGSGESGRADQLLHDAGFDDPARESVLIEGASGVRLQRVADDVADALSLTPTVANVNVTAQRDAALVQFNVRGEIEDAGTAVEPALATIAKAQREHGAVRISQSGEASIVAAMDKTVEEDFKKAEISSVPLTLLILFIAFGALVAALVPVVLGLTAVVAALGLIALPSQAFPLEESAASVILLIGLAVGVDYALFYIRRMREERAAGATTDAAIEAAAKTSGHTVMVSGFTVMASVAGMFFAGNVWYSSYAIGIIVVVAIAMIGSVTVLPAVLSKLGDRIEKVRVPFRRREREGRMWDAVLSAVMRRPAISAAAATAVLVALAIPATGLNLSDQGIKALPQDLAVVQAHERIQERFPGGGNPAVVAVEADDVQAPAVRQAIRNLSNASAANHELGAPLAVDVNPDRTVARVTIPIEGSGVDERSEEALAALRDDVIPAAFANAPPARTSVTGWTAASVDFKSNNDARAPIVFAVVLAMAFIVLMFTFRSIVIPIKAIVLNLLSVAAAYGVLTLVFQHGWGDSLLGFEATGSISTWLPVLLFVILFGLSMDYHVFILSRVREAFDSGMSMDRAVEHGIKSTAAVVTSAALVMVAVFSIFATLSVVDIKQLGVGLAVAVLIDATIVRAVLLPASMKLLGEWNWWMPRLPRRAPQPEAA
jgi:RND superfamily putative drug exporter